MFAVVVFFGKAIKILKLHWMLSQCDRNLPLPEVKSENIIIIIQLLWQRKAHYACVYYVQNILRKKLKFINYCLFRGLWGIKQTYCYSICMYVCHGCITFCDWFPNITKLTVFQPLYMCVYY